MWYKMTFFINYPLSSYFNTLFNGVLEVSLGPLLQKIVSLLINI